MALDGVNMPTGVVGFEKYHSSTAKQLNVTLVILASSISTMKSMQSESEIRVTVMSSYIA